MDDFDDFLSGLSSTDPAAATTPTAVANTNEAAKVQTPSVNSIDDLDFLMSSLATSPPPPSDATIAAQQNDGQPTTREFIISTPSPVNDGRTDFLDEKSPVSSPGLSEFGDMMESSPVKESDNSSTSSSVNALSAGGDQNSSNTLEEFADMLEASPGGLRETAAAIEAELEAALAGDCSGLDAFDEHAASSAAVAAAAQPQSAAAVDDYLSWLDESPPKPPLSSSDLNPTTPNQETVPPPNSVSKSSIKLLNLTSLSSSNNTAIGDKSNNSSVNNFFDEVFGGSGSDNSDSEDDLDLGINLGSPQTEPIFDIDAEVNATAESSFPDIARLRKILLSAGRLPPNLRGKVWCLLLNGFYVEDQEAEEFKASTSSSVNNGYFEMRDDCDAAVNSTIGTISAPSDPASCREDLYDLLSLYCTRKETEYNHLLCKLFAPMLVSPHRIMSRGLAFSCFYPLCSKFIPLINLPAPAFERAISKLCDWLRLLVVYHFPDLALHLDRVVPGWEKTAASQSASENRRRSSQLVVEKGLDDLEAEMGLGIVGGSSGDESSEVIESARPTTSAREASRGSIPLHWICGLFAGSAPSDMICRLWDWILLNNDRYSGIYLTATLLGIFQSSLMTMSGSEIEVWFQRVAGGSEDWYANGSMATPPSTETDANADAAATAAAISDELRGEGERATSWPAFMRGWMYATEALKKNTPMSFLQAISETEEWAGSLAHGSSDSNLCGDTYNGGNRLNRALDDEVHKVVGHSDLVGTTVVSDRDGEAPLSPVMKACTDETDSNESTTPNFDFLTEKMGLNREGPKVQKALELQRQAQEVAKEKFAQIQKLAKEQAKYWVNAGGEGGVNVFGPNNKSSSSVTGSDGTPLSIDTNVGPLSGESRWLHDNLRRSVCLWTDSSEVVPCLCSNRRKPTVDAESSIASFYLKGIKAADGDSEESVYASSSATFPQSNQTSKSIDPPFFFGIDCRSEEEKSLGKFPKAFDMNANFIIDSEEVSMLLETLQPLANSVHLCIIGAGEVAVRNKLRKDYSSKKSIWEMSLLDEKEKMQARQEEQREVERLVDEDLAKLNGAAMFFIKRGFSKVSVLHGGFMSAAKYLLREDSALSMDNALVDVDEQMIYNILSPTSKGKMGLPQVMTNMVGEDNLSKMSSFMSSLGAQMQRPSSSGAVDNGGSESAGGDDKPILKAASGVFQKMSILGTTLMEKSKATFAKQANGNGNSGGGIDYSNINSNANGGIGTSSSSSSVSFVIDEDEDEDEDSSHGISSHGVSVEKSGAEKKQALAMHRLAGIVKGETIAITKDSLPGAVLFPAFAVRDSPPVNSPSPSGKLQQQTPPPPESPASKQDHRYLVVTRERFIVLDSKGEGVGATATICSNNHLTELIKMTFRKKDPDLVNLFFLHSNQNSDSLTSEMPGNSGAEEVKESSTQPYIPAPPEKQDPVTPTTVPAAAVTLRPQPFRIAKRKEFIEVLQKNMQRFK